jgi:hypothetical protein
VIVASSGPPGPQQCCRFFNFGDFGGFGNLSLNAFQGFSTSGGSGVRETGLNFPYSSPWFKIEASK